MKTVLKVIPVALLMILLGGYINLGIKPVTMRPAKLPPAFLHTDGQWADSVLNSMTLDEKLGQFFMIPAYSNKGNEEVAIISRLIKDYHVGGIIFFQGGPVQQAILTNRYQAASPTPLLIAQDAEWGLSMRLDSTMVFPRQMTLGAIEDETLIYDLGCEIARQCKRIGVNVNFAPVIDVNNNPANPVINNRSFGENKINVARKGLAYMLGLQDNKVIATAKHFPGHGDTDTDSHLALPVIAHSIRRLDTLELYPFRYLIDNGLGAVMSAHLHVPALDSTPYLPSSLSPLVVGRLLKEKMGFKGLIFTDALGMSGVAAHHKPGEADLKAFLAGNDILLMSKDIPGAIARIKQAIADSLVSMVEVDRRCLKILRAKQWLGLDKYKPVEIKNIYNDLHTEEALLLHRRLIEHAITVVKDDHAMIPMPRLDSLRVASVAVGNGKLSTFQRYLSLYDDNVHFQAIKDQSPTAFQALKSRLRSFDVVIVGVHKMSKSPPHFGLTPQTVEFINDLATEKTLILVPFGSPYALDAFNTDQVATIVNAYEDTPLCHELAAQLIYGGIPALGHLPVSVGRKFRTGTGIRHEERTRLKYSIPLELGIHEDRLKKADSIALAGIEQGAYPGCEILCAKDGVVFYYKSFGNHIYESNQPVYITDIFDLASVTKVTATLPCVMKLYDEKRFELNAPLGKYLPLVEGSNKEALIIKDILTHQARLASWLPFYTRTLVGDSTNCRTPDPAIYSTEPTSEASLKVAENMYIRNDYADYMYKRICSTNLLRNKKYKYSDLGFYLMHQMIENLSGETLDSYARKHFYEPLGATTLCFNPIEHFEPADIVPTERDTFFRRQLLRGYVHDYGAAMLGGVAGHAGLFSNANDLAKLLQMYLQKGEYGGRQYLSPTTLEVFTSAPYKNKRNRRGIGFDKPKLNSRLQPVPNWLSANSYGHTGFTGTQVWVDPDAGLVYIFLSNRVYPSAENNLITELNIRLNVLRAFYEALGRA